MPKRVPPLAPFEIAVVSNTPLTPLKDLDEVALLFLTQIGYIPKGYDPKTEAKSVRESVPYRLFLECFMGRADKGWTVEQLATRLRTTKATIYRHINKLKDMDLLDEVDVSQVDSSAELPTLEAVKKAREPVLVKFLNDLGLSREGSVPALRSRLTEYVREQSQVGTKKGYRIRYGNLSKAWNFVESNVQIAMENYRKTVDHVQNLSQERR